MSDDVKIAGNRTVKDWQQFRKPSGPATTRKRGKLRLRPILKRGSQHDT